MRLYNLRCCKFFERGCWKYYRIFIKMVWNLEICFKIIFKLVIRLSLEEKLLINSVVVKFELFDFD